MLNWFCEVIITLLLLNLVYTLFIFFKIFLVIIFISLFCSFGIKSNLSSSFLTIFNDLFKFSCLLIEINSLIFCFISSSSCDILYEIDWAIFNSSRFLIFLPLNIGLSISLSIWVFSLSYLLTLLSCSLFISLFLSSVFSSFISWCSVFSISFFSSNDFSFSFSL